MARNTTSARRTSADVSLGPLTLRELKSMLRQALPYAGSGHVDEALARAFGFNTHIALLASITPLSLRDFNQALFEERLAELTAQTTSPEDTNLVWLACFKSALSSAPGEPGLAQDAVDRCKSYGVRMETNAQGRVFAHHNVGGCLGPFQSEALAAQAACSEWNL